MRSFRFCFALYRSTLWIDVLFPSYIHQLSLYLQYFTDYHCLQLLLIQLTHSFRSLTQVSNFTAITTVTILHIPIVTCTLCAITNFPIQITPYVIAHIATNTTVRIIQ